MKVKFDREDVEEILIDHLWKKLGEEGFEIKPTVSYGSDFEFLVKKAEEKKESPEEENKPDNETKEF